MKDFFGKCDQSRRKLRIWLHLLNKSLMENLFFVQYAMCNVSVFLEKSSIKKLVLQETQRNFIEFAQFKTQTCL